MVWFRCHLRSVNELSVYYVKHLHPDVSLLCPEQTDAMRVPDHADLTGTTLF